MQQQFIEAGTLMLAGMVFVFAFLSLLILFINTVLAKLAITFPDPVAPVRSRSTKPNNKTAKAADGSVSPAVVAAISSAVTRYRQQNSQ